MLATAHDAPPMRRRTRQARSNERLDEIRQADVLTRPRALLAAGRLRTKEQRMAIVEVKVPDIGDFRDVPVIEVLVEPGAAVKAEDPLVTLESDKATMDVPSPAEGIVKTVAVKVGDKVSQGSTIVSLETGGASSSPPSSAGVGGASTTPPSASPKGSGAN